MDELFKLAQQKLQKDGIGKIYRSVDIGDRVVFFGETKSEYGCNSVSVHKETHKVEWFNIHWNDNMDLIENGKEALFN